MKQPGSLTKMQIGPQIEGATIFAVTLGPHHRQSGHGRLPPHAKLRTEASRDHCRVLAALMNSACLAMSITPASGSMPAA